MNERKRAVALQYRDKEELPRVLTAGAGEIAERLVALARERGIPVKENGELVELLSKLDAGAVISPDTFKLVAEIISFLYHCDKVWREAHPFVGELAGVPPTE